MEGDVTIKPRKTREVRHDGKMKNSSKQQILFWQPCCERSLLLCHFSILFSHAFISFDSFANQFETSFKQTHPPTDQSTESINEFINQ